jgi:hypothetical protein
MSTSQSNESAEGFVVEVDGKWHSGHVYFGEAIKTALLLRNDNTSAKIRVRDLLRSDVRSHNDQSAAA